MLFFLVWKFLFYLVKLKTAQSEVPIVLMIFLYEARAHASYRKIIGTIGTPFYLNEDQEGSKKTKESHQRLHRTWFSRRLTML